MQPITSLNKLLITLLPLLQCFVIVAPAKSGDLAEVPLTIQQWAATGGEREATLPQDLGKRIGEFFALLSAGDMAGASSMIAGQPKDRPIHSRSSILLRYKLRAIRVSYLHVVLGSSPDEPDIYVLSGAYADSQGRGVFVFDPDLQEIMPGYEHGSNLPTNRTNNFFLDAWYQKDGEWMVWPISYSRERFSDQRFREIVSQPVEGWITQEDHGALVEKRAVDEAQSREAMLKRLREIHTGSGE